jgi:hypothetical protein
VEKRSAFHLRRPEKPLIRRSAGLCRAERPPSFHGAANRRADDDGEIIAFRDQDAPTPAPGADRTKGRITRNGT